jgi:hypothetical protein
MTLDSKKATKRIELLKKAALGGRKRAIFFQIGVEGYGAIT